ncbi:energy transducer TonB [Desulfogranum mediterraneum]|uniref:energy transducer TonB n=1 Tax=Desulfogranum mediterraneum TaxID=160661 RepID=UPI000422F5FA|nr:energy transducer TonB [Desulfogranum mediterraneum]
MAVPILESDFYLQQRDGDNNWQKAAAAAVLFHLALIVVSLYAPGLLPERPLLDNVVTVDLISLPEPSGVEEQPEPAPEPVVEPVASASPPPEPVVASELTIPAAVESSPAPPPAAKPVSVRPFKRKLKRAADTRLAEERQRAQRAAELRRDEQERKRREQLQREQRRRAAAAKRAALARQEAEKAARDARKALADMYRQQRALAPSSGARTKSSAKSGAGQRQSVVARQYWASLYQHIQAYWVLPEMRKWNPSLEAIVVIKIDRQGRVMKTMIEKKSNDRFFDQLVVKTINKAAPMPRFPKLMKEATLEVGLRFRPGTLEM